MDPRPFIPAMRPVDRDRRQSDGAGDVGTSRHAAEKSLLLTDGGMAEYYFNLIDHEGLSGSEESYAFPDLEAALAEAEIILGEMALDGLPKQPFERLEVEVLDHSRVCVARISLELRRQIFA
jgi:hypothetical protein